MDVAPSVPPICLTLATSSDNVACKIKPWLSKGIKGWLFSLHPKNPAEAPSLRSGTTLRSNQLDEAEHFYAQSLR